MLFLINRGMWVFGWFPGDAVNVLMRVRFPFTGFYPVLTCASKVLLFYTFIFSALPDEFCLELDCRGHWLCPFERCPRSPHLQR